MCFYEPETQVMPISYSTCPSTTTGYRLQRGAKCYEFILNERKDWIDAQMDCRKKGGRLVTIETKDEEQFVEQILRNYNYHNKGVWIGLNDIYKEGTFVWDSGKPVTFTRWGSGQPDDFRYNQHQDCVLLYVPHHYEQHHGVQYAVYYGAPGWHDQACQDGFGVREDEGWICEYYESPSRKVPSN
ncbi:hypothetical protein KUTeg_002076 [Tegillarca granosa]|uniref:C-type lectin domain-containing protein n=1 Tax=Tegillarca granosa TaxID=220873 RepID=A0ABQ9FTB1_TEGGR|nr:hypothetical protein KUTeg_002076 [Tegillarca granosa]